MPIPDTCFQVLECYSASNDLNPEYVHAILIIAPCALRLPYSSSHITGYMTTAVCPLGQYSTAVQYCTGPVLGRYSTVLQAHHPITLPNPIRLSQGA